MPDDAAGGRAGGLIERAAKLPVVDEVAELRAEVRDLTDEVAGLRAQPSPPMPGTAMFRAPDGSAFYLHPGYAGFAKMQNWRKPDLLMVLAAFRLYVELLEDAAKTADIPF